MYKVDVGIGCSRFEKGAWIARDSFQAVPAHMRNLKAGLARFGKSHHLSWQDTETRGSPVFLTVVIERLQAQADSKGRAVVQPCSNSIF